MVDFRSFVNIYMTKNPWWTERVAATKLAYSLLGSSSSAYVLTL